MSKLTAWSKDTMGLNSDAQVIAKRVPVKNIVIREPFISALPINSHDVYEITQSMRESGYDESKPVHIWKEENILVDGHTRLKAAKAAGIEDIPVCEYSFADENEALIHTLKEQINRRNLNDAGKLMLIEKMDVLKKAGRKSDCGEESTSGKSAEAIAKQLGTSRSTVERARAVLKNEEAAEAVKHGKKSISKAYTEIQEAKKAERAKEATEDDLNDLPFTDSELGNDTADSPYSGDAFDLFDNEDDDEDNSEVRGGIDLASLISDCMKIAERYDLEVEEDGCKTSPLDDRIIYSVCIKFSLAGKVINPQIFTHRNIIS